MRAAAVVIPRKSVFRCPGSADTLNPTTAARDLVRAHVQGLLTADLFARNCELFRPWANDSDPSTCAPFHMDAAAFVGHLERQEIAVGAYVVDPPYSDGQAKEKYGACRESMTSLYAGVRRAIDTHAVPGALVVWLGWSSVGMSWNDRWQRVSHSVVQHGWARPDTHVVVDRLAATPLWPKAVVA